MPNIIINRRVLIKILNWFTSATIIIDDGTNNNNIIDNGTSNNIIIDDGSEN